jgi:outer membrane protein OmpA-like peptidoglycan-associated protein
MEVGLLQKDIDAAISKRTDALASRIDAKIDDYERLRHEFHRRCAEVESNAKHQIDGKLSREEHEHFGHDVKQRLDTTLCKVNDLSSLVHSMKDVDREVFQKAISERCASTDSKMEALVASTGSKMEALSVSLSENLLTQLKSETQQLRSMMARQEELRKKEQAVLAESLSQKCLDLLLSKTSELNLAIEEKTNSNRASVAELHNCITRIQQDFLSKTSERNLAIEDKINSNRASVAELHTCIIRIQQDKAEKKEIVELKALMDIRGEHQQRMLLAQRDMSDLEQNYKLLHNRLGRTETEESPWQASVSRIEQRGSGRTETQESPWQASVSRIEQRGNIMMSHATGQVVVLRNINFVMRTGSDSPQAVFEDPAVADAVCKDLAEVSGVLKASVTIQGHTKGGESEFWRALARNRARAVADRMVDYGADPSLLNIIGLPGRLGKNLPTVDVFMGITSEAKEYESEDIRFCGSGPRSPSSGSYPGGRPTAPNSSLVPPLGPSISIPPLSSRYHR